MSHKDDFTSESWRCRWVCPDPAPCSAEQASAFEEVFSSLPSSAGANRHRIDCVGAEMRLALFATEYAPGGIGEGDNGFWKHKCRILFLRPAVEPIAISYWDRLLSCDLDVDRAQKIVSALAMKEQPLRVREGVGRSKTGLVGFELPERARSWLSRIKLARENKDLSFVIPAYTFAATIMAHPFADGNGRLARILSLGALAELMGWNAPIVGIAPSFYRHAESLGRSLDILSNSGDWRQYYDIFTNILRDIVLLNRLIKNDIG